MTSYEQLYVPFFNRIEEDANFFSYYKITADEALEIAKKRAKNYLNEAVSIINLCSGQALINIAPYKSPVRVSCQKIFKVCFLCFKGM